MPGILGLALPVPCAFSPSPPQGLACLRPKPPTFSSREATLKASSVTLPAAQRAALEVCSSFQVVSVSTCREGARTRARINEGFPQEPGPMGGAHPRGQGSRGGELGRQRCLPRAPPPQRQGLLCPPIPAASSSPALWYLASPLPAAWRLPPRSEEEAWRYLGGTWGLGREGF